jgi:hypothetical protein
MMIYAHHPLNPTVTIELDTTQAIHNLAGKHTTTT